MKKVENLPSERKIIKIIPSEEQKKEKFPAPEILRNSFIQKLLNHLKQDLLVEPNSKILVAVSGGVDSISLLDALYNLKFFFPFEIAIAHMNHMLRGEESTEDELFVKEIAEKYGLLLFLQKKNVKKFAESNSLNLEEAARILRYDFLKRAGQSFSAKYIATGHNANDQAETVLFRLFRGTGIAGLQGINRKFELSKDLYLIRPFLIFFRAEIETYAKFQNLKWREDSSNLSGKFVRNKIRRELIPYLQKEYNPNIVENLNQTALLAQSVQKIVSNFVKDLYEKFVFERNSIEVELSLQGLQLYDDFLISELLQEIFRKNFDSILTFKKIEQLKKLFKASSGKILTIQKDVFAFKNRDKIIFLRKDFLKPQSDELVVKKVSHFIWNDLFIEFVEVPKSEFTIVDYPNIEYFDFDKISDQIRVRSWKESDRFVPLGMNKKVKLSDFFINQKISLIMKSRFPIFVSNEEIFWVGGLRISDKFKVTKRTKRVLKGIIKKLEGNSDDSSF